MLRIASILFGFSIARVVLGVINYVHNDTITCDLASVPVGSDMECTLPVTYRVEEKGAVVTLTITNRFDLVDSTTFESFCLNPRITYSFLNNDVDEVSEYIQLFEGLTVSDPEIKKCHGKQGTCDYTTCLEDDALNNDYSTSPSSIGITIFVSAGVEGIRSDNGLDVCPGGNKVESNLTITCERGICGSHHIYDITSGECIRDCNTFAIDEYLECSTTYTSDISVFETTFSSVETELNELRELVDKNTRDIIGFGLSAKVSTINEMNGVSNDDWNIFSDSNKDFLLLTLLTSNLLFISIGLILCYKLQLTNSNNSKSRNYHYESSDVNVNLKD